MVACLGGRTPEAIICRSGPPRSTHAACRQPTQRKRSDSLGGEPGFRLSAKLPGNRTRSVSRCKRPANTPPRFQPLGTLPCCTYQRASEYPKRVARLGRGRESSMALLCHAPLRPGWPGCFEQPSEDHACDDTRLESCCALCALRSLAMASIHLAAPPHLLSLTAKPSSLLTP